jgi:cytidine deaminase
MIAVDTVPWVALRDAAKTAAAMAYCPYSGIRVGAAAIAQDGSIFRGCNIECASYALTTCAERALLISAHLARAPRLVAIVLYVEGFAPTTPCGACRQLMIEHCPEAVVQCICDGPEKMNCVVTELLPVSYRYPRKGEGPA